MKKILILLAAMLLAGCSSYRGGTSDDSNMSSGRGLRNETGSGAIYKPGMDLRNFEND